MFAIKSATVLFSMFIVTHCQRKITDGKDLHIDRRYVVYLVKAPVSQLGYDAWLCGGAIVTSTFVVTSAACVNDVEFVYVIAGYKKYIKDHKLAKDNCTSTMKKKVIYTCSPQGYELKYGELDYWADIDIALVKVESPFNFDDPNYEILCSYKPTTIPINYDAKYEEPGDDALVFGWGHAETWRRPGDTYNYNQKTLKYTSALIMDKDECLKHFTGYANMSKTIKRYMICSLGKGNIDDEGKTIQHSPPIASCTRQGDKVLGMEGVSCEPDEEESEYEFIDRRRSGPNYTDKVNLTKINKTKARRSGICQNDHGGPLITWAGASEILIGVASVFKVSEDYQCMGPYLYTSTVCTGIFLNCMLTSDDFPTPNGRRYLCDRPAAERGYKTIERTISWKKHPAGAAENENIGRAGPEPKISAGLKYLSKNIHQPNADNKNVDSNNTFQAYKNSPIVSNAPKNRFSIQERDPKNVEGKNIPVDAPKEFSVQESGTKSVSGNQYPVNYGHQEESKSNKIYLAYNSPVPVNNEPKDKLNIQERIPERKNISEKPSLLTNSRSPEKSTFLVNGRSSGQQIFSVNNRYPFNERQQGNENQRFPVIRSHPVSKGPPKYFQGNRASLALRSVHPIRN
ncbi:hypothetical protein PYW08_009679 [Mythimna loreyi]|uniref:Uncharacterized protein n=1 Tax=Mythimna loreyi TaxID=667449 RepID=A0ACC2Q6N4_9NEOP|nr:hypothetical protein PYW08_009679 [Mythimna loreyi]